METKVARRHFLKLSRSAKIFLGLLVWFVPSFAFAQDILVGVGLSKPPYIIQDENSGAELDIVRRGLEIAGYNMKIRYMPLKRIPYELNGGALDAGMAVRAHMAKDGFFSKTIITYQNYGITLAGSDIRLKNLQDLAQYRVTAFQNASTLLGPEFSSAISENRKYHEVANQALQIKMLAKGRTDVVISDFRIFLHFKQKVEAEGEERFEVEFHPLFAPSHYGVAFQERQVRDDFDAAIDQMKSSGEYTAILQKYIREDTMNIIN
ncbi:substrate-binding periplasmic protein [Terasakiella sp.]|uniref:substrate-binding periplasmic protein n=1 Tax=Terasakiella sp. TaxID=2034861 RepID=UPI003AA855EB